MWSVTNSVWCFHRYLINFLLDATLGMLVIYGGVKAVSAVVEWRQWDSLRFGEYGMSLNISWNRDFIMDLTLPLSFFM